MHREPRERAIAEWTSANATFWRRGIAIKSDAPDESRAPGTAHSTNGRPKHLPADKLREAILPPIVNGYKVGGGEDAEFHARSIGEIIADIYSASGNWPRRHGNTLFVDDPKHGICHLLKVSDLFGWLHSFARVQWFRNTDCVGREDLLCELQRTATAYQAIETIPHFPPRPGHYYAYPPIKPGDGSTLAALLARFNPATEIDRDLIQALIASAFWGGEGGTRPLFVVVSEDGRGLARQRWSNCVPNLAGGCSQSHPPSGPPISSSGY